METTLVGICAAKTYRIHFGDATWTSWANVTINDTTGEVWINSDWGHWAHQWSPDPRCLGEPTITAFLSAHDRTGYVYDKMHYGRQREEFDPEATAETLHRELAASLGLGPEDSPDDLEGDERELWDAIDDVAHDCGNSADLFLERLPSTLFEHVEEAYLMLEFREPQSSKMLRERILPAMFAVLIRERELRATTPMAGE